ncbi:MAG TPA: serine hydrolase domain-containing protein [Anaerolineales bacterium]|nr:serine hydrolase domain-containing protein [Anaerolineales bacterium]
MNKNMIVAFIIALFLVACNNTTHSAENVIEDRTLQFENGFPVLTVNGILLGETTTLVERMEHYYVPGVSITVISDYEIDWAKGYGVQDAKGRQPVTPETLFPPASIGKTLTAVATLHYVDAGLVELDRDVNELLKSWKIPENEFMTQEDVTLRRLLSHTAGVSQSGFKGYLQGEEFPNLTQILDGEPPANNRPIRVDMVPGTQWRYSGGGYQIVEQLLVDVAGVSFPAIMQETILEPVGMNSTIYAVELPEKLKSITASAHGRWGQPIVGNWLNYPHMGAGASWTTPTDLAQFVNEIMLSLSGQSNRILSQEMANLMLKPHAEGIPFIGPLSMDWGLGWQLNELSGEQYISHGGDIPEGYQNLLVVIPEQGWGVVIMTNGVNGDALRWEILYTLAAHYGFLPSLRQIILLGYLLLVSLSVLIVWASTFLIRRARLRKLIDLETHHVASRARVLILPAVITVAVVSISYYTLLAVGLGSISGPPQVSAVQAEALGKVEQGELLAEHGMIKEALASFAEAKSLEPDLEIPASAWNQLCIRGSVWGYVADVIDACEKSVILDPENDGMLFGRGLARALTDDNSGAVTDFKTYVEWTKDNGFYDPYGIEVEIFILELEAGRNPFDEEQLDEWR